MKYIPARYQTLAEDFCMKNPKCALFLECGLGKTVIACTVFKRQLTEEFAVSKCLVIAPKTVAEDTWTRETAKWDHLQDLRVIKLMGTADQRRRAIDADADLWVINRENVVWLVNELMAQKRAWPWDMVIIDELSSFKSSKSLRFRALRKVLGSVTRVIGLTGTPAPNGYMDLWPQIYLLDRGKRLGSTLTTYREHFFDPGARNARIIYEWRLKHGAKERIDRALSDICLSMQAKDWLELPEIIYREYPVAMSAEERKVYQDFERDHILPVWRESIDPALPDAAVTGDTAAVTGDTAAITANKLLQMASGDVYDSEGGVVHIHDRKTDALETIYEAANGQPLLVFYSYKPGADAILARFPEAEKIDASRDTTDIVDRWNRGQIPMLLAHPASAGYGLNLQAGGHLVVWYSLPWSLELYQQANKRLHRVGQTQSVIIQHLTCEGTMDEQVVRALQTKDATQSALLDALKKYVGGKTL